MTIIGNGLIAKAFRKNKVNDDIVIIASGVSNSKEDKECEFLREEQLIKDVLLEYRMKKIIYFSTCSILQSEHTPYIKHKLKMEELIKNGDVSYYIFRLPQVVGVVNNDTLVSYLARNTYLNNPLYVQEDAFRNLIDIEDLVRIVKKIIESSLVNSKSIFNISSSSYINVLDIATIIVSILQSKSQIILVPGGEKYYIDNSELEQYIEKEDKIFSDKYAINIINKYTRLIEKEFSFLWKHQYE